MTRFTPCGVKRVSPLIPSLRLTIRCTDFILMCKLVPYIFNVVIELFKICLCFHFWVKYSKNPKNDTFYPASPYFCWKGVATLPDGWKTEQETVGWTEFDMLSEGWGREHFSTSF